MKNYLRFAAIVLIFVLSIVLSGTAPTRAATTAVTPVPYVGPTSALSIWPFVGAVGFGALIVVLDAEAVDFPLCGPLKCTYTYPGDYQGVR